MLLKLKLGNELITTGKYNNNCNEMIRSNMKAKFVHCEEFREMKSMKYPTAEGGEATVADVTAGGFLKRRWLHLSKRRRLSTDSLFLSLHRNLHAIRT